MVDFFVKILDIIFIVIEVKMLKQAWFIAELAMSDRLQNFVKSLNFHHHHPSVYEASEMLHSKK